MDLFKATIKDDPAAQQLTRDWIDALRSGRYTQGTGSLRSGIGKSKDYCCLGVLCDLVGPDQWNTYNGWRSATDNGLDDPVYSDLPDSLRKRMHMSRMSGGFTDDSEHEASSSLVILNDGTDVGFAGIADQIERELNLALA